MNIKIYARFINTLFFGIFITSALPGFGQNPFVTVWKTDNPTNSASSNSQIEFPAQGSFSYSWVDINDSTSTGSGTGTDATTITFPQAGSYELSVTPTGSTPFHWISFCQFCVNDKEKLLKVKNWGSIQWTKFQFNGCYNLKISATDTPNLSNVEDLSFAFSNSGIDSIPNINGWDISNITDLGSFFQDVTGFNQPLSNWDVSNVTNMDFMFDGATSFNQPLDTWDMSKVIDISYMFRDASSFNQSLASWDLDSLVGGIAWIMQTAMSCENYSYTLQGWANNPRTHSGVIFDAHNVEYSPDVVLARNYLIDSLNWTFQPGDVLGTCNIALGVDFMKFTVRQEQARAILNWTTASEANNSGFEIQRSTDGLRWKAIGFVTSTAQEGNSVQPERYHFYDDEPLVRSNYYRLKQYDFNGRYTYSVVQKLLFAAPETVLQLYPNPAGNYVKISGLRSDQTVQLYDLSGRLLQAQASRNNENTVIDLSTIAPGIYYLKVTSVSGQVQRQKLIRL